MIQIPTPSPDSGGWFFQHDLPAEWQWIALVLAVVGVLLGLMAVPPIAQMLWGRASVGIDFRSDQSDDEEWLQVLQCYLKNPAIKRRWLRAMGVRRDPTDVTARVIIYEERTAKQIASFIPFLMNINRESARHATLVGSDIAVEFFVVAARLPADLGVVAVTDMLERKTTALPAGAYLADVTVVFGDNHLFRRRRFVVEENSLHWAA